MIMSMITINLITTIITLLKYCYKNTPSVHCTHVTMATTDNIQYKA